MRTRRRYTEIYSYYSKTFDVVCEEERFSLFSLTVLKPNGTSVEKLEGLSNGELYDALERLKDTYVIDLQGKLK